MNGFSTADGGGFWLTYSDGSVAAYGNARRFGDASSLPLRGPMVGGAVNPSGAGYWLVATDGGLFTFGGARFYGSMGGSRLTQPVFSMAPTRTGRGYWLVARDGGIFTFGDGHFYGSMGGVRLARPINGITTSATGRGYRMVASDGGIFSFGDARFYGSLPGRGVHATDVVGMASTPSGHGYWIARSNGQVYAFGDAYYEGNWNGSPCDPIAAIFANPHLQGYRLVTQTGATVAFGALAPGGGDPTGTPRPCPPPPPPPPPPPFSFSGTGTYVPGVDIPAGTYRSLGGPNCSWARKRSPASLSDTIASGGVTPAVVTIAPTDWDFETQGCATWTNNLSRITSSPTAPFTNGIYIVNTDIAPGTWQSDGRAPCYWRRLSGFSDGTFDDTIQSGATYSGATVVTIQPSDRGIETDGACQLWTKIR